MNFEWEPLADGASRCRLPFLDVTIGLMWSSAGALLIDTGTTLTEARTVGADAETMAGREISHIVLTHHHIDHVLGASAFDGAAVYCTPAVATTMADSAERLRADAVGYGADQREVDDAVVAGADRTVVFCGDLVVSRTTRV